MAYPIIWPILLYGLSDYMAYPIIWPILLFEGVSVTTVILTPGACGSGAPNNTS